MASFCRSVAAAAAVRSAALRSRSSIARPFLVMRSPVAPPCLRRTFVAAALASAESLMPLHSAVAAARLRSCIAADSSCWSCLSQADFVLSNTGIYPPRSRENWDYIAFAAKLDANEV